MKPVLKTHLSSYVGYEWVEGAPEAFELFVEIAAKMKTERDLGIIFYPPEHLIFRAFQECPFERVKVVLWGAEPYIDGSGTGLVYDNYIQRQPISPALGRILYKIKLDTGEESLAYQNANSYLQHLPPQGVFLPNISLSVRKGEVGSHASYWRAFSKAICKSLNQLNNVIHIQLGKKVQSFYEGLITNSSHSIILGANPSPLSGESFYQTQLFTNAGQINW